MNTCRAALLGTILIICTTGTTRGQTTAGTPEETAFNDGGGGGLLLDNTMAPETPEETTFVYDSTDEPLLLNDTTETDWGLTEEDGETPDADDWTGEDNSTSNCTESTEFYSTYQTTGSCGRGSNLCCPGWNNSCSRVNCFCDEACYQIFHDCCSDYFPVCKGGCYPPPPAPTMNYSSPYPESSYPEGPWMPFTDYTTSPIYSDTGNTEEPQTSNQPRDVYPSGGYTQGTATTTTQNTVKDCIPTDPGRKFAVMCGGQRKNAIRHCDLYGCGCYGGPRGQRYLKGVDVACRDGATVYAPFDGTVQPLDSCYGDIEDRPPGDGFMFVGSGFCLKMFNIQLDADAGAVSKGCRLGTMTLMQATYPRIISHIHIQKCDLSDPTGLL